MNRKVGVVLSYILMAAEMLSTLLFTPFLIRTLGQAEYGVYMLVGSVTAYLALLDLGVGNSIVRFISKYRANNQLKEQESFLGIVAIYYAGIACVILALGAVLRINISSIFATGLAKAEIAKAETLLSITVINVSITIGTAGFFNTIIAYENFLVSKGLSIISVILRIVLSVFVLLIGMGSVGIVIVNLILTVLTRGFMVCYVLFKMKLKPRLKGMRFSVIKEIISYSTFILLQMIATQINGMADQILIGIFVPTAAPIIAVYAVGAQLNQYFQSIGGAFNGVLMPGVVRLVESGAQPLELQKEMIRVGRLNFMVLGLLWVGFLGLGRQFIELWAGQVNSEAYFVAALLMFPFLINLTQAIGTNILWAKNKHKLQAILKICIVLINVVITIILIKWNPLWGAVLGTFISLMLGDVVVMQIVFHKDLGISVAGYFKGLLKGILPCILLVGSTCVLLQFFNLEGWGGVLIKGTIVLVVYGSCMVKIGFNQYEKNLISSIVKKVKIKRGR